ncbi:MAG: PQQ-binding-like beta-propeller repeat protein [Pseudomonadota bacterium]
MTVVVLTACGERDPRLTGERLQIRTPTAIGQEPDPAFEDIVDLTSDLTAVGVFEGEPRAIGLSAPRANATWGHPGGTSLQWINHPVFSAEPRQIWRASVGQGDSRRAQITARPVSDGARIYTLDAASTVAATTTTGQRVWAVNLTPATDSSEEASGGGLSVSDGRVFATTAFGNLTALDAATGGVLWRQDLQAVASGAPTVRDGLVYVVSRDSRGWAIDVENGRVRWEVPGIPTLAAFGGGASPAVDERISVFPFSSGEVVSTFRQGGFRLWGGEVQGERLGKAYAQIGDISADPVLRDGRVYTGNAAGRLVALDITSGARVWTAEYGIYGPVWPDGGSLFGVTDQGGLVRLNASDGSLIWRYQLPYFEDIRWRRRKTVVAHYGPVIAGGRLYLASGDEVLRVFDPASGAFVRQISLRSPAAAAPIVVAGTMYILTTDAELLAFR